MLYKYKNSSQKIVDFVGGILLMIALNISSRLIPFFFHSESALSELGTTLCIWGFLTLGVIAYLGMTRYWIAIGMLPIIAISCFFYWLTISVVGSAG